ncbi:MAG TPA: APC family permease [Segeticoccus sp.]|uniref:APC family permease n=1 Tax=Segeticoccus sp. TaxID=2706531 RepID=UPI002D808F35|nr:APC family permease [Segeticoccus sp.]HET8602278.1 APC family permease [Segeticoccus sp.]
MRTSGVRAQPSSPWRPQLPETLGYALKRVLLGRPLVTEQLRQQRLSNRVALGVLSPDAISSSAYGPEQVLVELLPYAGLAAFTLLLPITGVILVILVLVAASYRQVLEVYTRAGGSYVVARDNFGPKVAQVAAAALLIDYVVTVAVQTAAGTVAVVSALPALGRFSLEITVGVVVVLCLVNLRGLREAGRPFALPTYFFVAMVGAVIVVGVLRQVTVGLPRYDPTTLPGAVPVHHMSGFVMGATLLVLLRAFANGGSSLTGVEAISNTVSVFREPRGANARKVLLAMAGTLGFLVAGVSYLAFATHSTPYTAGYPSVLSQEARAVFGQGLLGTVLFALVQGSSALILYTGANTSFNGFPFLASFVATDRFLPRQLTKRGHRLVFSNGILTLAVLAVLLLVLTGGTVTALVPFYAIGVFSGFAMAGFGMTRHHQRTRETGWRRRLAINLAAGVLSTVVVLIFAIAKFTEGAWLVVIVFPLLVWLLIRLNREYRLESAVLDRVRRFGASAPQYNRHLVLLFINSVDLAVLEAVRYGRSLRPDELRAVHVMVDAAHATALRTRWEQVGIGLPLEIIDCPDRRLARSVGEFVLGAVEEGSARGGTAVTVLLPRRSYAPVLGRLLHDRSADRIAAVVSRIPHAAATIIPFDVQSQIRQTFPHLAEEWPTEVVERFRDRLLATADAAVTAHNAPVPEPGATAISRLAPGRQVTLEGRLHDLIEHGRGPHRVLIGTLVDTTGSATLVFTAPDALDPPLQTGQLLRARGLVSKAGRGTSPRLMNPAYEVLETPPLEEDEEDEEEAEEEAEEDDDG